MTAEAAAYVDGAAWAAGPDVVYGLLAEAATARLPGPLDGRLALDAGAGTGAASRALVRRGARVVATDASAAMLRAGHRPAVVGDVGRLPFADRTVDLAMASFVLSHVDEPSAVLVELRRVSRAGGSVVATSFPVEAVHPVKRAVDDVLATHGYRPPPWYAELKRVGEARVGTVPALLRLAGQAGLTDPVVHEVPVDLSGLAVRAVAGWRLGMAQVVPYLAGLGEVRRQRLTEDVYAAVAGTGLAAPLPILVLHGRVPGTPQGGHAFGRAPARPASAPPRTVSCW